MIQNTLISSPVYVKAKKKLALSANVNVDEEEFD